MGILKNKLLRIIYLKNVAATIAYLEIIEIQQQKEKD